MDQDLGRTPSGRAGGPNGPEPAAPSQPEALIPNAIERLAKLDWEWERGLHDGATPDWEDIALPLRKSRMDRAGHLLAEAARILAKPVMRAQLPEGYIWGRDAMEQFNFGKRRAAETILELAIGIEARSGETA